MVALRLGLTSQPNLPGEQNIIYSQPDPGNTNKKTSIGHVVNVTTASTAELSGTEAKRSIHGRGVVKTPADTTDRLEYGKLSTCSLQSLMNLP